MEDQENVVTPAEETAAGVASDSEVTDAETGETQAEVVE